MPSFIGSNITLITKSKIRYSGTIVGIDADSSAVLLGSVKCYGSEGGPQTTNPTYFPVMSFKNADIEDLKIGDNDAKLQQQTQEHQSLPSPTVPSIHDDPAVLSVVTNKISEQGASPFGMPSNPSMPNVIRSLQNFSIDGESAKTNSGYSNEHQSLPTSKRETKPKQLDPTTSKFFDNFSSDTNKNLQTGVTDRYFQPFCDYGDSKNNESSGNHYITHSMQTANNLLSNDNGDDRSVFNNHPYSQTAKSYQQQDNFGDNGGFNRYSSYETRNDYQGGKSNYQYQQRYQPQQRHQQQRQFHNQGNNRRNNNYQQQTFPKQNRETFNDSAFESDFDFDQSNLKFDKIASESEFKQHLPPTDYPTSLSQTNNVQNNKSSKNMNSSQSNDGAYTYDKKKSFFDSISCSTSSGIDGAHGQNPNYRTKNQETFGNSYYQRRKDYNRQPTYNNGNSNTNDYHRSQHQQRNFYQN
ncbi:unnamed protein product [Didymodactylos carnosus]|uniref:Uncharacterized protein n=1 Tax=Didymodactylos carnosus TaxID=1234261 RepID=A0A813UBQ7_9BILA|nr:unnamed protein product [Didymodactylos carnosus]CAF0822405.1 unnamed protein product [Didymodactylos carnosus]CAF3606731.1 unnamed protein product [Didymodactylos carnosus]CAF3606914.1 unnamed protein product [Didymodactylos carnosus]